MTPEEVRTLEKKLADYFAPEDVKFVPIGKEYGGYMPCAAFVDARSVVERLNKVLGLGGWQDEYDTLVAGEVRCRLKVKVAGEWITRSDVGSMSEQKDVGDQCKAAHSDALKRAAIKFGVGLYLYRIKGLQGKYVGGRITEWPVLPAWAIPEDCQPAGKELGTRIVSLLKVCSDKAKCDEKEAGNRLLDKFGGYPPGRGFATVQLRDARDILQALNTWAGELQKKTDKAA